MSDRHGESDAYEERIAICTEAGVPKTRAHEIADCEEALRIGLLDECECGTGHARGRR